VKGHKSHSNYPKGYNKNSWFKKGHKAYFNRKHWTKFFQSLLSEKQGYNYAKSDEIRLEVVSYE